MTASDPHHERPPTVDGARHRDSNMAGCPVRGGGGSLPLPHGSRAPKIVQLLRYLRDPVGVAAENRRRFGPLYKIHVAGLPASIHIATASGVRKVFSSPASVVRAGEGNKPIEFILGKRGLFRLDGEAHRRARKQLMPSLHGDRVRAYGPSIVAAVDALLATFDSGQTVQVSRATETLTMTILLETIFRIPPGARHLSLRNAVMAFLDEAMTPLPALLSFAVPGDALRQLLVRHVAPIARAVKNVPGLRRLALIRLARATKEVDDCLFQEIRRRRQGEGVGADILSELVAAKNDDGIGFTDDELRDTLLTLLVAGYETTARTLAWALDNAVRNSEISEALHAEACKAFGGENAGELPYAEAVLRETLRLYPPVPSLPRVLGEPLEVDGITIPKGMCAEPVILTLQRDPAYWTCPMTFDPRRFLGVNVTPGTYLPFGGGLRTCPGMTFALYEMKLVLARIFERARLSPVPEPPPALGARGILLGPIAPNRIVYNGPRARGTGARA